MSKQHDSGYKEVFSYPEFVQQLIDGFMPDEISDMMDFSTLTLHSGNYITPLFEERLEDVVWSVDVTWKGITQPVFLYLLMEFQSKSDQTMPIRLMHYVACFYDHLIKNKTVNPSKQGLPPVLPIVLYNGSTDWSAKEDIYDMIRPEPPEFLKVYQPHLRYYLIDESRYTDEELGLKNTPLSGMFSVENAGKSFEQLQHAVDRVVAIIKADPNKERIDKIITRWIKRHLRYLDVEINLDQLNSLVEDKDMLADNLENLIQKERLQSEQKGRMEGRVEGRMESRRETALNLLSMNILTDEQISKASGLSLAEIADLRTETKH